MPLKLTDITNDSEVALENIEFIEETNVRYFRVSNGENIGINFQYFPVATSNWDSDRYEIYLLENSYLNAENDVFEVYESTLNERLGWIFPITILESNENDFSDFKNLNHYKFVTYKKLFELNFKTHTGINSASLARLSDVFGNLIICILSKETIGKISEFRFENYLLSLYKYGYLLLDDTPKSKPIYDRTYFIREMREKRAKVKLTKAKFDIVANDFTKSLFKEHLLQSESFLVRFIFLYQIIEHFIKLEFDLQFQSHLDQYKNHRLAKNDLRESIINSSRERELIKNVINPITISQDLKDEFMSECNFLFNEIGLDSKDSFPDKIYDIRNLLTHRLRDLTTKIETLNKLTEIFERIIIDLLINYKTKIENNAVEEQV